ncbi:hypothetical protein [Roseibium sp.]|uniref:hypothetical protein n=1 Tax=Roseibium sp. TaxID=1936156 RepID=UPI003A982049
MSETKSPGAPHGGPEGKGDTPAQVLEALIKGYLQTAALQKEYQSLHQSLPNVLTLAGEILKKKEESEKAYAQGLDVVEKVLAEASEKADGLSRAMAQQHEKLAGILADKDLLSEILRSGQAATAAAFEAAGLGTAGGPTAPHPSKSQMGGPAAGLNLGGLGDTQLANQLNTVMGNIRSMISQEVQRQAEILRGQGESGQRPN